MEDFIAQLRQRQSQFSDSQAHDLRQMVQQYLAEPAKSSELPPVLATAAPLSRQFAAKNLTHEDAASLRSRRQSIADRAVPVECNGDIQVNGNGVFEVRPNAGSDVLLSTCANEVDTVFTINGSRFDDVGAPGGG